MPKALFTHMLEKQLAKHVRPPTKKHRGTKMRQSKPVLTCMEVWQEQLSMTHNLPAMVSAIKYDASAANLCHRLLNTVRVVRVGITSSSFGFTRVSFRRNESVGTKYLTLDV